MVLLIALCLGGSVQAGTVYRSTVPDYIRKVNPRIDATAAKFISDAIYKYSVAYGLDPRLVAAVIRVESAFNTHAMGTAGEVGLMQLHPKFHYAQQSVDNNIAVGVKYLAGIRDVHQFYYSDLRWIELYNRGPFAKEPTRFPYTGKVLKAYAELGGRIEQQKRNIQRAKKRVGGRRRVPKQERGPASCGIGSGPKQACVYPPQGTTKE